MKLLFDGRLMWQPDIRKAHEMVNAALSEPPRNCDVGTAEEQARRYAQHCDTYLRDDGSKPCTGCSCCGKVPFGKCEFAWAQLPYESEAKE